MISRKYGSFHTKNLVYLLLLSLILLGCQTDDRSNCPESTPSWVKPPEDAAVSGPTEYGYYFVNEDRSIWASAWWNAQEEYPLSARKEGFKMGWFRPAGADLNIEGQRIDQSAAPLTAEIPCCYPTQFQATGIIFPSAGCWEITAKAEDQVLSFIVWVEP